MKYFVGLDQKYVLLGLAVLSLALYAVATHATGKDDPQRAAQRLTVCRKLVEAQKVLSQERAHLRMPLSPDDRLKTGWIGVKESILTTDPGTLQAKSSVTNPNFGAVVVDLLAATGVQKGDVVAIGMTGSFPALDAAVIIAAEELGAQPVIISSVGASQWGANEPGFTWPVMERALYLAKIVHTRSVAISRGGSRSLPQETIDALEQEAKVCGLPYLNDSHITRSIKQRMEIYRKEAAGKKIAVFVNVGGAVVNVGIKGSKINADTSAATGVLGAFQAKGIPTVDLRKIKQLCRKYNLPWNPRVMPQIGAGKPFRMASSAIVIVICFVAQLAALTIASRAYIANHNPLHLGEIIPATSPEQ